jgi:hypothetical protein
VQLKAFFAVAFIKTVSVTLNIGLTQVVHERPVVGLHITEEIGSSDFFCTNKERVELVYTVVSIGVAIILN